MQQDMIIEYTICSIPKMTLIYQPNGNLVK